MIDTFNAKSGIKGYQEEYQKAKEIQIHIIKVNGNDERAWNICYNQLTERLKKAEERFADELIEINLRIMAMYDLDAEVQK